MTELLAGLAIGFGAGIAPGPLSALVVTTSLERGFGPGARVAIAPLLTDTPIVLFAVLLSLPMLFREFHSRWLGIMGQIIAVTAVTAYVAGLTGPNWNELQIAGTLMMSAFAWNLLVGMRALLVKSHDSLIGKATI